VRTKSGTRQFAKWAAFYVGASSDATRQQKSTTLFGETSESATRIRSVSARSTIDSVVTALSELSLQEAFGKLATELRTSSSRWYERLSADGRRGIVLSIYGEACSKANSRRLVPSRGGKMRSIKSEKALDYADSWGQQCPTLRFPLTGDLRVCGVLVYASERPDLDESLVLDLMQGRIYQNDRQVRQKFFIKAIDTARPRAILLIEELQPSAPELAL
jgi:Holliday junction resolvase RusA-like endonuclease